MLFISSSKLFLFLRYLNFCLNFLMMWRKWLYQKDKVNLKIYVVTNLLTITIHMLTNILQSKGKQTIKFRQLIKCNNRNSRIMQLMRQRDQFLISVCFLKKLEVKATDRQLSFNIFQYSSTWNTIKTNCVKLQTINPEICSILICQKRVWGQFSHHILCMVFQEECFSYYILLTDQISFSALGNMFIVIAFFPDCDIITFIFVIKLFF